MVGARGFEPPASGTQSQRSTRLSYAPNKEAPRPLPAFLQEPKALRSKTILNNFLKERNFITPFGLSHRSANFYN